MEDMLRIVYSPSDRASGSVGDTTRYPALTDRYPTGSRITTGMSRGVFVWYSS